MEPTLTPELNPIFSILFWSLILLFAIVEFVGIFRKQKGDTFTENWRWLAEWLKSRGYAGLLGWLFRIFTGGLLIWAILHFLAGAE